MRNDENLRRAMQEIAQEETEQFARSLSREERRQAEEIYRHHRRRVLSLIRRSGGKKPSYTGMFLKAVAALAIVIGGIVLFQRQTFQEPTPLSPVTTGTVSPFYSFTPSPTETPVPTQVPTLFPTQTPYITDIPTFSPTLTPLPSDSPTPRPTETPSPTETPAPAETSAPTETPLPAMVDAAPPSSWQGSYFPGQVPAGYAPGEKKEKDGVSSVSFTNGSSVIVFTESSSLSSLPVTDGSGVTYVQWDGVVALRAEKDGMVELTWDQDGHSFSLRSTDGGEAERVARTVKKIR